MTGPVSRPARRRTTRRLVAALLAGTLAGANAAEATTLIDNVDGLTLDDQGKVERLTGLVIGSDGRIVQVLHRGDKRPAKVDYQLDGKGRVLMPGLVDSHVALMQVGLAALTLDLSPAKSLAEAQARIAAYAAAHPDHPWIVGRGWDEEAWGLGRMPTAAELDAAVKDRPVWLIRADGHAGWANSAALAAAGITAATKAPPGGRIETAAGSVAPAGVLVEAAQALVQKVVPPPRPEDRDLALASAQDEFLRRGVTAVADLGATLEDWQTYRRAGDLGSLRLRIMAYAAGTEAMTLIAGPRPTPWLYDDRLRLNGVSLVLDGALATRGALLKAPYADAPGRAGLARLGEAQLRNLMSRAAMDGFQVAVAANGDRAAAEVLDAIAELRATYKGDRRWRIEQLALVDPADFARLGQSGAIASMQPLFALRPPAVEARLGPARLAGSEAWASLAAAGARLAFGSDAPTARPDPWSGMASAITRQDEGGQPFGGWQPQERVSREAALAAYTTGGAWAGFADQRFGRLAAGLRADFVLLDRDPLLAGPADLRGVRVLETWVGGQRVWSARD